MLRSMRETFHVQPMRFDTTKPIPILLLSDGPDALTGLARICHDLARLLSSMPEFKVGVLGRNSMGRSNYPWANYSFGIQDGWGQNHLAKAWSDLSRGERGIVLTVWDATRLMWFADPVQSGLDKANQEALGDNRSFERWGYFMQDCDGVIPHRLPAEAAHVMAQYDRVLLASKWAHEITRNSLQNKDLDWMPHGINLNTFKPHDRLYARSFWRMGDEKLIGCVMSNQERKHWPTVFEAVARMKSKPRLWVKTDRLVHYWNLQALAIEYGLVDQIILEDYDLTDTEMAIRYSACDATVLISGGEGFCYPVAESLACGTPVITGCYGAQAELAPWTVPLQGYRIETIHNVRRAYYEAASVTIMLDWALAQDRDDTAQQSTQLVQHLDWINLGHCWHKWIRKGLS